ncbi:PEP-CTERM sorting domain-containing protein [Aeoliella sp.]|uniref:PEP-CTERM sorting domain-containing protein n=1 Tax=Aeoliella sp. TaxID=2795800 RepID=UPI003CCC096B
MYPPVNVSRAFFSPPAWVVGAAIVVALLSQQASALVVMDIDPTPYYAPPTTQTMPTGAWGTNVDPGWYNSTERGVYLGNGWVLSAKHTGLGNFSESLNGDSYSIIDGATVTLKNPTTLTNKGLTAQADLRIARLNSFETSGTPEQQAASQGLNMQSIHIASSKPSFNTQIVAISNGRTRPDGDPLLQAEWTGSTVPSSLSDCTGNCLHDGSGWHALGYSNRGNFRQAWGTNRVESSSTVSSRLEDFDSVSGTSHYTLEVSGNDTVVMGFDFDDYTFTYDGSQVVGGGSEIQAAQGDSGSGIYYWNTSQGRWELAGVMHSVANYVNTTTSAALRNGSSKLGDLTVFTDLSVYKDQIEAYMAPPEGYEWGGAPGEDTRFFSLVGREFGYDASDNIVLLNEGLWGDIDLDGDVDNDDVEAFVAGWGNEQATGDIFSWKQGDLNQDGITDLNDFLLLRSGFQQAGGASLNLSTVLGTTSGVVPEPSSILLLASGALGVLAWRWRRA